MQDIYDYRIQILNNVLRKENMSRQEFGKKVDRSPGTISNWMSGKIKLTGDIVDHICTKLNQPRELFDQISGLTTYNIDDLRRFEIMKEILREDEGDITLSGISVRNFLHPRGHFTENLNQAISKREDTRFTIMILDPFAKPARERASKEAGIYDFNLFPDDALFESDLFKHVCASIFRLSQFEQKDNVSAKVYNITPFSLFLRSKSRCIIEPYCFGSLSDSILGGLNNLLVAVADRNDRQYLIMDDSIRVIHSNSVSVTQYMEDHPEIPFEEMWDFIQSGK